MDERAINLQPIYVVGPTASGKSDFAYYLASKLPSVIISADSMQIYRSLDIGTAKDSKERRAAFDCRMIDVVAATDAFSVAQYVDMAKQHVQDALNNGKLPILVGGTGLYFEAMLYPMSFGNAEGNTEIRRKLENDLKEHGATYLHDKLAEVDALSAAKLAINDTKRVIRALEIYLATGKTRNESADAKPEINPIMVAFDTDRAGLYQRINTRVDKMMSEGLLEEVQSVGKFGCQSMQAIGYKEFAAYDGINLDAVCATIKKNTRNYAKRQLTWFRRYKFARWFEIGDFESAYEYVEERLTIVPEMHK